MTDKPESNRPSAAIDIAALIASIEPDPARQRVILREMILEAARKVFPPPRPEEAPRFAGGLPPDHSKGFGLPQSVVREMAAAVPDTLLRDIVREQRAGIPAPSGLLEPRNVSVVRGGGKP